MFSRLAVIMITTTLLFVSCDLTTESNGGTDKDKGTLRVYLTDAPANYDAVWIDIREVRIHLNSNDDIEDNDGGWITINDNPMRVNLIDLTNGELKVLGEQVLDSGIYSQIRLILGDENEIVVNGSSQPLDTPSAQQSGLKLNINADIDGGEIYTLLLDFDASRSIVKAGKSGKFLLKPVIRTVDLSNTGAIKGSVEPAESLPWIYAITNSDTLAGTKAGTNGEFLIVGLLPGTYNISIIPSDGAYPDSLLTGVLVTESDTTDVGNISLND